MEVGGVVDGEATWGEGGYGALFEGEEERLLVLADEGGDVGVVPDVRWSRPQWHRDRRSSPAPVLNRRRP